MSEPTTEELLEGIAYLLDENEMLESMLRSFGSDLPNPRDERQVEVVRLVIDRERAAVRYAPSDEVARDVLAALQKEREERER